MFQHRLKIVMCTHLVKNAGVIFLIICILYAIYSYSTESNTKKRDFNTKTASNNILDGCYHVYIDVGSNIGVQVRKLFEPYKYPRSPVHKIFNANFGNPKERSKLSSNERNIVYAVGFEPIPNKRILKPLRRKYLGLD